MRKPVDICKIYSIFLGIMPILAIYYSGIPGLNVADICLLIFYIFAFFKKKTINKFAVNSCRTLLFAFLGYILTICLLFGLVNSNTAITDIIVRTTRISFYIASIYFLSRKFLDFNVLKKTITIISVLSFVFILVQYLLYYAFNHVLHGFLDFLPLYTTEYATSDYSSIYLFSFRPTGPFLEPAHCGRYLMVGLCLNFGFSKKNFLVSILLSIAIVLSTSGQSLVFMFVLWVCYIIYLFFAKNNLGKTQLVFIIFVIVPIAFYMMSHSSLVDITLRRIGLNSGFEMTGAGEARLSTFKNIFEAGFINVLFGHGYGSVPYENAWQSGLTYILYGSGLIGFFFVLRLFLAPLKNSSINLKLLVFAFFLYLITDDLFNGFNVLLYGSIILLKEKCYEKNSIYCDRIQFRKWNMRSINY